MPNTSKKKASSTRAGRYVREEMHHMKKGEHRGWSRKQAVAVGLAKARRSGVKVPRKRGRTSSRSRSARGRK